MHIYRFLVLLFLIIMLIILFKEDNNQRTIRSAKRQYS
jgi:hypothetical protein